MASTGTTLSAQRLLLPMRNVEAFGDIPTAYNPKSDFEFVSLGPKRQKEDPPGFDRGEKMVEIIIKRGDLNQVINSLHEDPPNVSKARALLKRLELESNLATKPKSPTTTVSVSFEVNRAKDTEEQLEQLLNLSDKLSKSFNRIEFTPTPKLFLDDINEDVRACKRAIIALCNILYEDNMKTFTPRTASLAERVQLIKKRLIGKKGESGEVF